MLQNKRTSIERNAEETIRKCAEAIDLMQELASYYVTYYQEKMSQLQPVVNPAAISNEFALPPRKQPFLIRMLLKMENYAAMHGWVPYLKEVSVVQKMKRIAHPNT